MPGRAHRDGDVVLAAHLDRLLARGQRPQAAVLLPLVVGDPLEVEVGDVGAQVGETPGDVGVVADDDARHPGERETGDVQRAVLADSGAVQTHLHPRARQADTQVRVVGQQRLSGLAVLSGDDPAVAADPVTPAHQLGQPVQGAVQLAQQGAVAGGVRRTLRVAGTSRRRVRLEHAVHDRALPHDRPVCPVVVRREQLGDLLRRVVGGQQGPLDLLVEVPLQVPGHRLEPGQRVRRRPRLGPVVQPAEAEDGVLDGDLGRAVRVQVGIDARGVRLQRRPRRRLEQRQLLLGDLSPTQRADELVALQGVRAEQLRLPSCGDVPAHVHLVEPLLRVHVALRGHQVGHGVGVQLRDAVRVPDDRHLTGQPGNLDRPLHLRERPAHQDDRAEQAGDQEQNERHRAVRRPARAPRPVAEDLPRGPIGPVLKESGLAHGGSQCAVPLAVAPQEC